MRYASEHPNKGSYAVSSALEIPRGRIRPWIDSESKPDAVRALETAANYGWLEATYGDREFVALNTLVANIFSGGAIATENYRPSFALNFNGEDSHVVDALDATGIEYKFTHRDDDDRATEVRPSEDGPVLGRVLAVLGAPVGPKADIDSISLPWYLEDAPSETRKMFVLAYVTNRTLHQQNKRTVTIQEQRPQSYRDELAALIEDVAGEQVTSGKQSVTISVDATRSLGI
nr:hypothetical protein [Natronolimnobius sp. AArcel1]